MTLEAVLVKEQMNLFDRGDHTSLVLVVMTEKVESTWLERALRKLGMRQEMANLKNNYNRTLG